MKELEYPFDSDLLLQKKKSIKRTLLAQEDLTEIRIALLSGSTIGELRNMLELFLLNLGWKPVFYEGEYDRYYEELVFDNEKLEEFAPSLIYIHTTMRNLKMLPLPGMDEAGAKEMLKTEFERFQTVWDAAERKYHCPVIQNNFDPAPFRVLGNRDAYDPGGAMHHILEMNRMMGEYALTHTGFYINDLSYEAAAFGLNRWHDLSKWYLYKYAFTPEAMPEVAFQIANIIKAIDGKNKKALALDLDNTLWGGVIGDEGVEGIRLGIETPEGMAFEEFQDYLKKLSLTGIALNICSKNEEEAGISGFTHPASRLSADDFIVWKINWENKDRNIHEIAAQLNVGEDSIVFVDDNPAERDIVENQTQAAVLPLTAPEYYALLLDRSGYFENVGISEEDAKRGAYFKENMARAKESHTFTDYGEYLKSLAMECTMSDVCDGNIERVTQLTNKTNQFNLTTTRMTLSEVEAYAKAQGHTSFCGRLTDKYGDNGIVSIVMGSMKDENTLLVDQWLMSCRVFKRDLELAMFDELVKRAKALGARVIEGVYIPTKKNHLVAQFYGDLGFTMVSEREGQTCWRFDIPSDYQKKNDRIRIASNEEEQ